MLVNYSRASSSWRRIKVEEKIILPLRPAILISFEGQVIIIRLFNAQTDIYMKINLSTVSIDISIISFFEISSIHIPNS